MIRRLLSLFSAILVLAGAVVAAAGFWFYAAVDGDRTRPAAPVTVVVPSGSTGSEIAQQLQREGVIGSPLAFQLLARIRHEQNALKAGQFRFLPHQTANEILRHLVDGGEQIASWITIPEGFTAKEIARAFADHGLGDEGQLNRAFDDDSIELGGVRTKSLEGVLFPSTYLIPKAATAADIVRILTDQFRTELPPDATARAKRLGLTVPQVVTLASLIEREAKADDERRLMAGVYYNRLRIGMPLQVDATIEYTFPEHKDVITRADLASDSPYNTYKHDGLPPTPIANPGRPSLMAAFDPEPSPYLYYVYMGNGHHAFARTLAEHEANTQRYLH